MLHNRRRKTHADESPMDEARHGQAAVEVYPPDSVKRRWVKWDGIAAEIVQATRRERLEFHFRAPVHLLVVCDQGVRSDGDTFVEGLPRSKLRDVRRRLTVVPAGHAISRVAGTARPRAHGVFLFRSRRDADARWLWRRGCSSRMPTWRTPRSSCAADREDRRRERALF